LACRPGIDANKYCAFVTSTLSTRISEGRMNSIMTEAQSISAYGPARSTVEGSPLEPVELQRMQAYWNATLFLSAGMIYLRDNPLLREPLKAEHVKRRLLGHWGSDPGMSLTYIHLNRLIKKYDLNVIFLAGPGHGAPALISNVYLEGAYSEIYSDVSEDAEGLRRLFKQFSFPGGIGSHCTPETPGSIHEGGELGYSVSHAYGAAFDNPDLIVTVMVGDGESETGPLATAWHSNKFLNPARDGAVLPVLHLNGYKIANPTILARIPHEELEQLFRGYGYEPYFVEGSDPPSMHQAMAATLEHCVREIRRIQQEARKSGSDAKRPKWPVVILRSPKGWSGPKEVDGHKVEGFWRAHQVPMAEMHENPAHLALLEEWLRSYRPQELFDENGRLLAELRELAPKGERRMGANPHANGGMLRKALRLPDFRDYAVTVEKPGTTEVGPTQILGQFLRDVARNNPTNFRVLSPDENASNRLTALYEVTKKAWLGEYFPEDADGGELAPDGRVMEMLSEHTLEGWLEGYLLTGRHGFLSSYEAFVHVIDSMFNQHAKWLEKSSELSWRADVASLNLLITSTVWRQDHNGFTHQDPGFLDVVANKSPSVTRIYLPPDASCGDIATMEALAATAMLRQHFPELKVRFVNVVDLFRLLPDTEHPHGFSDREFDALFTPNKPVIFNFHAYPWLIHRLTYRRTNHDNIHVRGYKEKGNINTPMELAIQN
jgi:xylulose-5-phosphate/fructose-6-phosphate phosphoketolase